jgi:hypothetical protein
MEIAAIMSDYKPKDHPERAFQNVPNQASRSGRPEKAAST